MLRITSSTTSSISFPMKAFTKYQALEKPFCMGSPIRLDVSFRFSKHLRRRLFSGHAFSVISFCIGPLRYTPLEPRFWNASAPFNWSFKSFKYRCVRMKSCLLSADGFFIRLTLGHIRSCRQLKLREICKICGQ